MYFNAVNQCLCQYTKAAVVVGSYKLSKKQSGFLAHPVFAKAIVVTKVSKYSGVESHGRLAT